MDKSLLNQFRLTAHEKQLGIYGIKVENNSGESISHRWRSDDFVCLYSGSKTFTSIALGICIDEGRCTLDDKVLDFFPEYQDIASFGSEKISIRDLLHMASGKLAFWFGELDSELETTDWAELFFKVPVTKEPGTFFCYSNACTYMVGRIIEKLSGQNVRDFLVPRLFTPLGIFNPQWHMCPQGHTMAATGLFLTTDQFSRLGKLLLNKGMYEGKQIVSESYVKQATLDMLDIKYNAPGDLESSSGYGYQLWKCSYADAYRADGMYGQFCIVIPSKELIVTITAHNERNANDIIRAVFEDIVSYC